MYTCGPTVYAPPHIGNYRSFLFADLVRRYLEYKGLKVTQVMNITDIDDKTIRDSAKEGASLKAFTEKFESIFLEGMDLKYDYLKEVARDARLGPADDARVLEAKLAPFRLRVVRAALSLLQRHAQQHGTDLIVLYMTSVNDPEKLARQFDDIAPILDELDIPKINLADTFGARDDLSVLRIAPGNVHPNAAGHRLLFESLYAKITESPRLRRIVLGDDAGSASDTPGTYARAGS